MWLINCVIVDELKIKDTIFKEDAEELNSLENSIKNLTLSLDSKKIDGVLDDN